MVDVIMSVLIIIISALVYINASSMPITSQILMNNPGFIPKVMAVVMIFLSTLLLVKQILLYFKKVKIHEQNQEEYSITGFKGRYMNVGIVLLMVCGYGLLLNWIDFRISTFIFLSAAILFLAPAERRHWKYLITGIGVTLIVYIVFYYGWQIQLP